WPWLLGKRKFADAQHPAVLIDHCRQRAYAKMPHQLAALIKIEPPLSGLHQFERCAVRQDQLGSFCRFLIKGPFKLRGIIAVEKYERRAQRSRIQWIDPGSFGPDPALLMIEYIELQSDGRIEQACC